MHIKRSFVVTLLSLWNHETFHIRPLCSGVPTPWEDIFPVFFCVCWWWYAPLVDNERSSHVQQIWPLMSDLIELNTRWWLSHPVKTIACQIGSSFPGVKFETVTACNFSIWNRYGSSHELSSTGSPTAPPNLMGSFLSCFPGPGGHQIFSYLTLEKGGVTQKTFLTLRKMTILEPKKTLHFCRKENQNWTIHLHFGGSNVRFPGSFSPSPTLADADEAANASLISSFLAFGVISKIS